MAYLDLDQLLYTIYNPDMLVAFRGFPNHSLVTSTHPSSLTIRIIQERFKIGLVVVEITKDDGWRLNHQLTRLIVACDFHAVDGHDFCGEAGNETAARAEVYVFLGTGADDCASFGQAWNC